MARVVTDISDSSFSERADQQDILNTIYDELARIRASIPDILVGSATWDAASISDGDMESKDVTVTGAALGDFAVASMGVDVVDLGLSCAVTAADTVTATLLNNTGGSVNLASTTLRVFVISKTAIALAAMVLTK